MFNRWQLAKKRTLKFTIQQEDDKVFAWVKVKYAKSY